MRLRTGLELGIRIGMGSALAKGAMPTIAVIAQTLKLQSRFECVSSLIS